MGALPRSGRTVAAGICALGLAGAAVAHGALTEVGKTVELEGGQSGFVRVVCPPGRAAIAPGFETSVEGGARVIPEATTVFSARRVGLTAENIDNFPGEATGHAYCSNLSPVKLTSRSAATSLSPGESASAIATCPGDLHAVGGAFNTKPDAPVHVFESRKAGRDRWRVSGTSIAAAARIDLEAQVICQRRKAGLRTEELKSPPAQDTASATAACDRSELLLSGGYRGTTTADGPVFAYASHRDGKRKWLASAFAEGEVRVTAYAYCAPR